MVTDSQVKAGLTQAINMISVELGSDCPVSLLDVLVRIPRTGEISVSELRKQAKMTGGGMSRLIAILAGIKKEGRRSMDALITLRDDPLDRRYSLIALTDEGRNFLDRLISQLKFYFKED